MSQNPIRMARIVAEVTGDHVTANGDTLMADPVEVSLATRAHLANNGWITAGSEREFTVYEHVKA